MPEIGIKGELTETVTEEKTAAAVGSGDLRVYATPAMAALMEKTAMLSVADTLESGKTTVGTRLDIEHSSASPVGAQITCMSELIKAEGRRLVFVVTASDNAGEIGKGTHERFIVDAERFFDKTSAKLEEKI
ncbi:MAG: thioesterase family protein [Ruminiclostridium sp.]|nr:thioesterase family protein [Ruminiclostridium sp.]